MEISHCCHSLKTVLHQSSDAEFVRLCVVLSCILHSSRPLHHSEMSTVMILLLDAKHEGSGRVFHNTMSPLSLLPEGSDSLICSTESGHLQFVNPLFSTFLKNYAVDGIDQTPLTLARACLSQMETNSDPLNTGLEQDMNVTPFAGYASLYWAEHYRSVERSNPELIPRIHRILCKLIDKTTESHEEEVVGSGNQHCALAPNTESYCKALLLCQRYEFEVLQSMYAEVIARRKLLTNSDTAASENVPAHSAEPTWKALASLELREKAEPSLDEWIFL